MEGARVWGVLGAIRSLRSRFDGSGRRGELDWAKEGLVGCEERAWAEGREEWCRCRYLRRMFRSSKLPTKVPAMVLLYVERLGYQTNSECDET